MPKMACIYKIIHHTYGFYSSTWQSYHLSIPKEAAVDDTLITSLGEEVVINIQKLNKEKGDMKPSTI